MKKKTKINTWKLLHYFCVLKKNFQDSIKNNTIKVIVKANTLQNLGGIITLKNSILIEQNSGELTKELNTRKTL